jgi:hypothetical protein
MSKDQTLTEKYGPFFPGGRVPLSLRPRPAAAFLNEGVTELYEQMKHGEFKTFKQGKARHIDVMSLLEFHERRIAEGTRVQPLPHRPNRWTKRKAKQPARRRGRPRKLPAQPQQAAVSA